MCEEQKEVLKDNQEKLNQMWLCDCGYFEESEFHCSRCGSEPPWGCHCEGCQGQTDDYDPDLDFGFTFEDDYYP